MRRVPERARPARPVPHVWEIEEVDGGAIGTADFWICHGCGASGGPVGWFGKEPPTMRPFLADGSGLKLSADCLQAARQIAVHQLKKKKERGA